MSWQSKSARKSLYGIIVPAILLFAILMLGGWLRLRQATDSLWLDELHTAWVVDGSWQEIGPRAAQGNQSPLYFYAVASLTNYFGQTEIAVRLLSLIAGGVLPFAAWFLSRKLLQRDGIAPAYAEGASLLAAWLVAVDPTAIFFAQEARPYACVQLLAVLHVLLFVEVLDRPTRLKRCAWIACGGLLFYLHYTSALLIIAELAFALGWFFRETRVSGKLDRSALAGWVVDVVILGLLVLPTLKPLSDIYHRRENWSLFLDRVGLWQLADLPVMVPWSAAALYFLVAYFVPRSSGEPKQRESSNGQTANHRVSSSVCILLGWLLVPIAIVAATSALDWLRLWHVRYLIAATPAAYLLAARLPLLAPGRRSIVVGTAIFLVAGCLSHYSLDWSSRHGFPQRSEDWRSAVAYLNEQPDADPILLRSGLIEADALRTTNDNQLVKYCCLPLTSLYPLKRPAHPIHPLTMTQAGNLPASLLGKLAPARGESRKIWLVVRGDEDRAAEVLTEIEQSFSPDGIQIKLANHQSFGRVQVQRLELVGPK
jgi:hypothetical protein